MRITELLKQESIGLNVSVSTKEEAIDKLVDLMAAGGRLKDKAGYKEGILAREALGSTGIGGGIGIGIATGKATEAISRQPEASGKIQTNLLLGAALAEGTAIFGFVVALLIILFLGQ